MSDGSTITEKIFMQDNHANYHVLKVAHHGSRSSTSQEFVNSIKPQYAIISVGRNNFYGHPNKEVLENLKESKIYRTDMDGSIIINIKKQGISIETYNP